MKKLISALILFGLVLSVVVSHRSSDRVLSAPNCAIANQSVSLNNGTFVYNQVGIGSPILLLHGLFAAKEQWDGIMCQLSEEGYRAIAPDLPGYGKSTGFALKDYALENQVELLHQWLNQLGIKSFEIAGSSMGGTIAALYAQRYPNEVKSLAFIGAPLGVIDWAKSVRAAIIEGINPFIPVTKEQFDLEIRLLFVNPPSIPDAVKTEKVNNYVNRNRQYQQTWDIVNLYKDVLCQQPSRIPTFALWGKEDKIYDIQGSDRLKRCIRGSKIMRLPNAGHLLLIENATEATSEYKRFLQSVK
jgi:abhydrolase domain-containing protein 6